MLHFLEDKLMIHRQMLDPPKSGHLEWTKNQPSGDTIQ